MTKSHDQSQSSSVVARELKEMKGGSARDIVVVKCLMTGIKFSPITGGGADCSLDQPGALRSSYSLVCIQSPSGTDDQPGINNVICKMQICIIYNL